MAVIVATSQPQELKRQIITDIKNETIETWEFDQSGVFFTHKADQWRRKAWFKMTVRSGELVFNIVRPKNGGISSVVYAEYHGLLIRMLLAHYEASFTTAGATALAVADDDVSAKAS